MAIFWIAKPLIPLEQVVPFQEGMSGFKTWLSGAVWQGTGKAAQTNLHLHRGVTYKWLFA